MFRALLTGPMREGHESDIDIQDVRAPVFKALLYFAYTDSLPDDLQVGGHGGGGLAGSCVGGRDGGLLALLYCRNAGSDGSWACPAQTAQLPRVVECVASSRCLPLPAMPCRAPSLR